MEKPIDIEKYVKKICESEGWIDLPFPKEDPFIIIGRKCGTLYHTDVFPPTVEYHEYRVVIDIKSRYETRRRNSMDYPCELIHLNGYSEEPWCEIVPIYLKYALNFLLEFQKAIYHALLINDGQFASLTCPTRTYADFGFYDKLIYTDLRDLERKLEKYSIKEIKEKTLNNDLSMLLLFPERKGNYIYFLDISSGCYRDEQPPFYEPRKFNPKNSKFMHLINKYKKYDYYIE